ncbi:MAG: TfoX/Sxy family protein [Nitrospirota bacterium]
MPRKHKAGSATTPAAPDARFESLREALLRDDSVTPAKMFGSQGLKVRGKVFAMLVKGRLVVKLPRERVEALVESGRATPFDPGHGHLMKEWAAVEPDTEGAWTSLAEEAKAFVVRSSR